MLDAEDFISVCAERGYNLFTGVPCSFLEPLINHVIQSEDVHYIAAASEGEAVGIASGASFAGAKAVVMFQNSGLGNAVNPLTSLNYPFRIPILLIVTLRGETGLGDEPQHELMGEITENLLDTLRIPWALFPDKPEDVDRILSHAEVKMSATGLPFALIMKKGAVSKTELIDNGGMTIKRIAGVSKGQFERNPNERIARMEAIRTIRGSISDEDAIIATTGKIGRELFTLGDRHNQLYVVGSMGCVSGIGLGIQYVLPEQRVVVLDGDGAVLMKMGTLATIGHYRPERFIHIILDNESYESTGSQGSSSVSVDFCDVATACGYRQCFRAENEAGLTAAVRSAKTHLGPAMIHVKVSRGSVPGLPRPGITPVEVKERFTKFLKRGVSK
jgi:phosphonopyruvate decarboxylase